MQVLRPHHDLVCQKLGLGVYGAQQSFEQTSYVLLMYAEV